MKRFLFAALMIGLTGSQVQAGCGGLFGGIFKKRSQGTQAYTVEATTVTPYYSSYVSQAPAYRVAPQEGYQGPVVQPVYSQPQPTYNYPTVQARPVFRYRQGGFFGARQATACGPNGCQ